MQFEFAELSLLGHREDNQDRASVAVTPAAALMIVIDGMGGHSDGALAAETARASLLASFGRETAPLLDPLGFLHRALGRAHEEVCALGRDLKIEARPRATCAICLVQQGMAYWAHIGDSRVYHVRAGELLERTRDHSHVEVLLQEGVITEAEVQGHPMRNFVECCIGGDPTIPEMSISGQRRLAPGDLLLACSDGLWANLKDTDIASVWRGVAPGKQPLAEVLGDLGMRAVQASAPFSDNTTATVLRWAP